MTGDTIHLISNPDTEKLDSLIVFKNAFIISKDTISTDGYNQISGQRLIGLFNEENKLRQVDIIKNAESIFYVRDDKQELFTGLREGLKLMKPDESVTFIFPSQKAYGYYGDDNKIGTNIPLICEVTLNTITQEND